MKTFKIFVPLVLGMLVLFAGCKDDDTAIPQELLGQWKLVAFADTKTSELRTPLPADCKNCYRLTFYADGRAGGFTVINSYGGTFSVNKDRITFSDFVMTEVAYLPPHNEDEYMTALDSATHYSVSQSELKIYYNNRANYLLFKKKEV